MSDVSSNPGDGKASYDQAMANLEKKWAEYIEQFGDNETCLNSFFETVGVSLFICPNCKSLDVEKFNASRTIRCRKCKEVVWITAGTLFHRIRLPLVWFGSLWLMANGVTFNANQLHKVAGVAYSTAWKIYKKVTMAIATLVAEKAHSVPSSSFAEIVFRRSRETPARGHPRDEESEIAREQGSKDGNPLPEGLDQTETIVFESLSATPCHFEELCTRTSMTTGVLLATLTILEINGFAKCLPGNLYVRQMTDANGAGGSKDVQPKVAALINASIQYIRETFHGVSRRYLQLYLAAHWCWADRKRWTLGALLQHCLEVGEISSHEIFSYVSPPMVQLVELPTG